MILLQAWIVTRQPLKVSATSLKRCQHQDAKALTTDLMTMLFSQEVMETHSLTGQRAAKQAKVKPKINETKIEALKGKFCFHAGHFQTMHVGLGLVRH